MKKKIEAILGIYYVAPHSSPDGVTFKQPRCGDCFCSIQKVHTHSGDEELVKKFVDLFKEYKNA